MTFQLPKPNSTEGEKRRKKSSYNRTKINNSISEIKLGDWPSDVQTVIYGATAHLQVCAHTHTPLHFSVTSTALSVSSYCFTFRNMEPPLYEVHFYYFNMLALGMARSDIWDRNRSDTGQNFRIQYRSPSDPIPKPKCLAMCPSLTS